MEHRTIRIKNVVRLVDAGSALMRRAPGTPGMGLVWGASGYGKSTAVAWFVNRVNGVYVRAIALWSPSAMLKTIARELGIPENGSCSQLVESCAQALSESNRPLFIDEADYVIEKKVMTETLRDLHDLTGVPVILVGMDGIQKKIRARIQVTGRLSQWIEMQPCDLEDARMLAEGLIEDLKIGQKLLARLHAVCHGATRQLVVGLGRIEAHAKARALKSIDLDDWKLGDDFFWGNVPNARKPAKETEVIPPPKAPVTPLRDASKGDANKGDTHGA